MSVRSRCSVTSDVLYNRRAVESVVRKISSSRQSPNRSAWSTGFPLVSLFDRVPSNRTSSTSVLVSQSHLLSVGSPVRVVSSNSWSVISRSRSPSHQVTKFAAGMVVSISSPSADMRMPPRWFQAPSAPTDHDSAPSYRGSMSPEVPRPVSRSDGPEDLAGGGVTERRPAVAGTAHALVHGVHLQAVAVRVEVADVHGVAVTEPGVVEARPVVVDRHGAEHDLVEGVAVHVRHGQLVVALPLPVAADLVGVEHPAQAEVGPVEVVGCQHGTGVVAAGEDRARRLPVEVGNPGEEPVDAVAVAVAPVGDVAPGRGVVDGVDGGTGLAVEDGEELRAGQDVTGAGAVVGVFVTDHLTHAVDRAVRGLDHDLGLAVAVEVEHEQLGVVRSGPDVAAHGDAPQLLALEGVGVDEDLTGVATA